MNILHVVPYYPPDRVGGLGEVVSHVHRELLRRGHDSRVLTSGASAGEERVLRIAGSPGAFARACYKHIGPVRAADVVHVHHGEALGLLLATKVLRLAPPVLLTLHASPARIRDASRPFELDGRTFEEEGSAVARFARLTGREVLDRFAMLLADQLSFISRSGAVDFLGKIRGAGAQVVYNGVPAPPPPQERTVEPATLLFVGTFSARKRVHATLSVLARVRERRPEATLRLVGVDSADHPDLLRLAEELGVREGLLFEGVVRSDEIGPFYRAADVLLVPSAYEGLPMVILEAFRQGLPAVATDVSGHPEIIDDGRNGFLVPVDRPDRMAEAALQVLEDPELRHTMADAARALVGTRFTVRRQTDEYLRLYERLRSVRPRGNG